MIDLAPIDQEVKTVCDIYGIDSEGRLYLASSTPDADVAKACAIMEKYFTKVEVVFA